MPAFEYRHRTGIGTFTLEFTEREGVYGWDLFVDDQFVEFFPRPWLAAAALARGDLDRKLGLLTRHLAIPPKLSDWNRSR
jgi:hypothetical protein